MEGISKTTKKTSLINEQEVEESHIFPRSEGTYYLDKQNMFNRTWKPL